MGPQIHKNPSIQIPELRDGGSKLTSIEDNKQGEFRSRDLGEKSIKQNDELLVRQRIKRSDQERVLCWFYYWKRNGRRKVWMRIWEVSSRARGISRGDEGGRGIERSEDIRPVGRYTGRLLIGPRASFISLTFFFFFFFVMEKERPTDLIRLY